ncbi:ATP-binding protein [Ancylomarina sp. 16SWW S1-10-2]|uniref:ATP-binding protein n=1 Tax=Ancylomarina sp. 16SWW S1-10-2 TaxID=2499681 RepID=UPI0012ADACD7|nr:ATP-binding protein [Ancylomarina sp. 16SWW S1-10-2]MRT93843.1 ATP-binding protein [Ancylomarina sp. 16SWW S1-10-2]
MAKSDNLLRLPSRVDYLKRVENLISNLSSHYNINQEAKDKVSLAVLEAVKNAICHGNKLDYKKTVTVHFQISENSISCEIMDEGDGFDFLCVPDPTLPENIEKLSGRGLFLMNYLADSVKYSADGRHVKMIFNI